MYNGNVQQNYLCVEFCVTKGSRQQFFIPMQIQYSYEHTFVQTAVDSMRRNPVFEIVQESVKVCTTVMFSRTLYAQNPVWLRVLANNFLSRCKFIILTSTPLYGSRLYAKKILCSKLFKRT